jgi:hypothetical protein
MKQKQKQLRDLNHQKKKEEKDLLFSKMSNDSAIGG